MVQSVTPYNIFIFCWRRNCLVFTKIQICYTLIGPILQKLFWYLCQKIKHKIRPFSNKWFIMSIHQKEFSVVSSPFLMWNIFIQMTHQTVKIKKNCFSYKTEGWTICYQWTRNWWYEVRKIRIKLKNKMSFNESL